MSVPVPHPHLHQKGGPGSVIIPQQQKTHFSLIPAGSQHGLQHIFSLFQKFRHIICLIAQMLVVGSPARRHFVLPGFLPIDEKAV